MVAPRSRAQRSGRARRVREQSHRLRTKSRAKVAVCKSRTCEFANSVNVTIVQCCDVDRKLTGCCGKLPMKSLKSRQGSPHTLPERERCRNARDCEQQNGNNIHGCLPLFQPLPLHRSGSGDPVDLPPCAALSSSPVCHVKTFLRIRFLCQVAEYVGIERF